MEEAAKVIGGVAGELVFYAVISAGIFDAAWLRADYFFAVYFVSQSFFWTQDVLFWTFGSF